jgi:co-chaperonin GroES (HSP10)
MRVTDINKVKPAKDNVVVKTIELDSNGEIFFAKTKNKDLKNAELAYGEVIAVGPTAEEVGHCPGVSAGSKFAFNRFAGSHIATSNLSEIYKILDGYSLIAELKDLENLNEDTILPTDNRLLLAVKFVDEDDSGVYLGESSVSDPSLEDLDYGLVIRVGPSCKLGYRVGDLVAYHPYAGEQIRAADGKGKPALRVLIEEEVLLTI